MQTIRELVRTVKESLAPCAGNVALYEAEQIVMHVLKCSRPELYLNNERTADNNEAAEITRLAQRRLAGEPLGYVLGETYFYNTVITLTPAVLIPRPETEVLVETILSLEKKHDALFLDIGTGSGAITAAILSERQGWKAIACDISYTALKVAGQNIANRCHFLCADCLLPLAPKPVFDFIVSNPPYISTTDLISLDPSVRNFEPQGALDGGADGLRFYRCIASNARSNLKPGGRIYCEIDDTQAEAVRRLFGDAGWINCSIRNDLSGRPRVFRAVSDCGEVKDL